MAFPDTWLQAWLWLEFSAPAAQQPPNTFFTASVFWYRLASGTFPSTSIDISDLISNTADQLWFACGFSSIQLLNSKVTVYGQHPTGGFSGVKNYATGVNDWTGYFPSYLNVNMRRLTTQAGRRHTGRLFMPHVLQQHAQNDVLSAVALGQWSLMAQALNTDVFSSTSLWRPVLVSYADAAMRDLNAIQTSQKLSIIRHRVRPIAWTNPQYLAPKPPPP